MKTKSLISAIKKTGLNLKEDHNRQKFVNGPKYVLSFYDQNGGATCVHLRRHNDHSDLMTDYHAGFFSNTIKYAIQKLTESAG